MAYNDFYKELQIALSSYINDYNYPWLLEHNAL